MNLTSPLRHIIQAVCIILLLSSLQGCVTTEPASSAGDSREVPSEPFDLVDGDRVVFLGNSLMEYDLKHGYLEYALLTRFPDRDITFRNLGWSGDTVFGESRGYFTTPPDAYGHLLNQLESAEPSVVFVAYGVVESLEGEEGLPRFEEGLNQLLKKIDGLGAEVILLSPIPHFESGTPVHDYHLQNDRRELYTAAIASTARERGDRFVDLYQPLLAAGTDVQLTTNGIHLNENGYLCLAITLERGLGLPGRESADQIQLSAQESPASDSVASSTRSENGDLIFTIHPEMLPLISRESSRKEQTDRLLKSSSYFITVSDLEEGTYVLSAGDTTLTTATASEWSRGIQVQNRQIISQADLLRELIIRKNDLFFRQYRPQNRTYLTGFRSHEQGQNAVELEQLDPLISRLENQISRLRKPDPFTFRLSPVE